MHSYRMCCSGKQTQGARLTAIVSVVQLKGQQLSSAIPYFHEPHPGFPKTIFRHKIVLCALSGFGLYAQSIWNFVGKMPVSHSPDLGPSTHFTQQGEQLSDSNCFHPLTLSLCYLHITVIPASLLMCGISASRCSQQFLQADLEQVAYQKSIF